ncbi:MAG TPA: type II toxin-antitoxin system prevent-host-death family antitoxin [Acidiphilium sp.]
MHSVGVFEAKNRLTSLLDEVESGGEILITRRGRPIARLVPAEGGFDRAKARRTADELQRVSKGANLAGLSIRGLIDEGRR